MEAELSEEWLKMPVEGIVNRIVFIFRLCVMMLKNFPLTRIVASLSFIGVNPETTWLSLY